MNRMLHIQGFGLIWMALLGLTGMVRAQGLPLDNSPKWEIGVEAIRFDFNCKRYMTGRYMNLVQPMPGFYVRRMLNRFTVRAGVQVGRLYFGDREYISIGPGSIDLKGYSIGFYSGASYVLTKKSGWLHVIGDISWQSLQVQSMVTASNTAPPQLAAQLNQDELFLRIGINPRIPISKHLCIGTELTLGRGVRLSHHQSLVATSGLTTERISTEDSRTHPMANIVVAARF